MLELYREHRISSGKAAGLLGVERSEFLARAASVGVPWFDLSEEEFDVEAAEAARLVHELRL